MLSSRLCGRTPVLLQGLEICSATSFQSSFSRGFL